MNRICAGIGLLALALVPTGSIGASKPVWQGAEEQAAAAKLLSWSVAGVIVLAGVLWLVWLVFGATIAKRQAGVVAEYLAAPPDDTPPALVGLALDGKQLPRHLVASLVDLSRRGYVELQEGGGGALVRRKKPDATLRPFESRLMTSLFGPNSYQPLRQVRREFRAFAPDISKELDQDLVRAGFYQELPAVSSRRYARVAQIVLVVLTLSYGLLWFVRRDLAWLLLPNFGAVGMVALGLLLVSGRIVRQNRQGALAIARWKAFRRTLNHATAYKMPVARHQIKRHLAYAIAFGIEKEWSRRPTGQGASAHTSATPDDRATPIYVATDTPPQADAPDALSAAPGISLPSLDSMAANSFGGLNTFGDSFFNLLNTAAAAFDTNSPSSEPVYTSLAHGGSSSHYSSSSSSDSSWSSSSSDSSWSSSSSDSSWSSSSDSGSSDSSGGGSSGFD